MIGIGLDPPRCWAVVGRMDTTNTDNNQHVSEEIKIVPQPVQAGSRFQVHSHQKLQRLDLYKLQGEYVCSFDSNENNIYQLNPAHQGLFMLRVKTARGEQNNVKLIILPQ